MISFNIQDAFVKQMSVFDTRKRIIGLDDETGEQDMAYNSTFPYKTYAAYIDNQDNDVDNYIIGPVKENNIRISTDLKEMFVLDPKDSYYRIKNNNTVNLYPTPANITITDGEEYNDGFTLAFNMFKFKDNIDFFLRVKYKGGSWILEEYDYISGSITFFLCN